MPWTVEVIVPEQPLSPVRAAPAIAVLLLARLAVPSPAQAGEPELRDLYSDTWVATDALGRPLPGYRECGPPKPGRTVGIFYFLWLGQHGTAGPFDITKIMAHKGPDKPWGPVGRFHHWGRPELGYYISTDEYVFRRHAHMLAQAGVDAVLVDVTNGFTYDTPLLTMCRVFHRMRTEGARTPQIALLTNSHSDRVVTHEYRTFYAKGLFKELWFRWRGKPLILSKTDGLSAEIKAFFTFRRSWAWSNPRGWFGDGRDRWPWIDHCPQKGGWHDRPGAMEEIPVAVAQHPTSNIGRSFLAGKQPPPGERKTARGLCFAEQWKRALEVAPPFVFVTGWNEWVAQRFVKGPRGGAGHFLGRPLTEGETYFVDQYSQEFSRDIEPMAGGHGDNYYYQMVANIRRYKGVRPPPVAGPAKAIAIDGAFADWGPVTPEYRDAAWDTAHRDHPGWGSVGRLVDKTGRNDFVTLKATNDETHAYFYARTRDPITPHTDSAWMQLYIDADADPRTGRDGYDFVVNRTVSDRRRTTLQRLARARKPTSAAELPYAVEGNELELCVPLKALGLAGKKAFTLDFHWADNVGTDPNAVDFALRGDSAPDRRFNYRYIRRAPVR